MKKRPNFPFRSTSLAPLFAILLLIGCKSTINYTVNHVETPELTSGYVSANDLFASAPVYDWDALDSKPEYIHGDKELQRFMGLHAEYPFLAIRDSAEGEVILRFVVYPDSTFSQVEYVSQVHPALEAEAIRVARLLPKWIPAQKDGQAVASYYYLPVDFKFIDRGYTTREQARINPINNDSIYQQPEVWPKYPGGREAMYKHIFSNMIYPQAAFADGVYSGRVTVRFTVGSDGVVRDVEVLLSDHPSFVKEAVKVILSMPNWEPGTVDGKPVPVYMTLPARFQTSFRNTTIPASIKVRR